MKAIKNILMTSAVIACTMLCLFSCTSKDMLSIAVEACAEECPMDLGGGLVMTDVAIQNGDVVYLYEMDENFYDIARIKSDPSTQALMKEAMLEELNNSSDKSLHDFITIVRKSNADIIYRYVGSESGKGFDIVIDNSEL